MSANPSRIPIRSPSQPASPSSSTTTMRSRIPRTPSPGRASTVSTQTPPSSAKMRSGVPPFPSSKTSAQQVKDLGIVYSQPEQQEASAPRTNNVTCYVSSHLGEPCTIGALDHLLVCGHKVMTEYPEHCASNCTQPHSDFANPRDIGERLVCMACVVTKIQENRAEKVRTFEEDLKRVAKAAGKEVFRDAVALRVEKIESGWKSLEHDEIEAKAKLGRFSWPFYVDASYEQVVETVLRRRIQEGLATSQPISDVVKASYQNVNASSSSVSGCATQTLRTNSKSSAPSPSPSPLPSFRAKSKLPIRRK